jgi:hypothetical protein
MEIVAHGLFAAAAAVASKRSDRLNPRLVYTLGWSAFPDVLAFGPSFAVGLWIWLSGGFEPGTAQAGHPQHVHLGLPLYAIGHSLLVFVLVFSIMVLLARRVVVEVLGWLLHILLDIPTHSFSYYATRFLWPVSDFRVDGIAWWTPWFWACTYVALGIIYVALWRTGWHWKAIKIRGRPQAIPRNVGRSMSASRLGATMRFLERSTGWISRQNERE